MKPTEPSTSGSVAKSVAAPAQPSSAVARLDFTKPPPGFGELFEHPTEGCWHVQPGTTDFYTRCFFDKTAALADAWDHHERRHDPPGMWSGWRMCGPLKYEPNAGVIVPAVAHLELWLPEELRQHSASQAMEAGRRFCWVWYRRRAKLAKRIDSFDLDPVIVSSWPRCLTWLEGQVDEVESWLERGGGTLEVLRVAHVP